MGSFVQQQHGPNSIAEGFRTFVAAALKVPLKVLPLDPNSIAEGFRTFTGKTK